MRRASYQTATNRTCRIVKRLLEMYSSGMNRPLRFVSVLVLATAAAFAQGPTLPAAPGSDTVQRVCGTCHPATVVLGRGMTREGWAGVVASMVARGAKGTSADFEAVTDYLAKNLPVKSTGNAPSSRRGRGRFPAGPSNGQIVDAAAAARGKAIYSSDCGTCHGPLARGTAN